MSVIYQPKTKCKDGGSYFYKYKEDSPLEKEIFFFSYSISEIPIFSYVHFFRKHSMFHQSIPKLKLKFSLYCDNY